MSRPNEKTSFVRRPVGPVAVAMALAAGITGLMVAGLATAPVRLPADVQAAFFQRASQSRFNSIVAGDVGAGVAQGAAAVLIDSPRR